MPAHVTPKIRPGVAFVAFHWPGSANELTAADRLDPHSRMPAFKAGTVRVQAEPARVGTVQNPVIQSPLPSYTKEPA